MNINGNGNGNGSLTLSKVLIGFASSLLLLGTGAIVNATIGGTKELAALKMKTDMHDAQFKAQDDRFQRIETKIDNQTSMIERIWEHVRK